MLFPRCKVGELHNPQCHPVPPPAALIRVKQVTVCPKGGPSGAASLRFVGRNGMGRGSPTPSFGTIMRKAFNHLGSLKLLSVFTRPLLNTGCHPYRCPEPAGRGSLPPPTPLPVPSSVTSCFTPQRGFAPNVPRPSRSVMLSW